MIPIFTPLSRTLLLWICVWVLLRQFAMLPQSFLKVVETSQTSVTRPNILHQHFEGLQCSACEGMFTNTPQCFLLPLIGWFWLWHDWQNVAVQAIWSWHWPWHTAARGFYLTLPFRSFYIGCECKLNLLVCGRYTIDCEIVPMQNTQIDHVEVAGCSFSVSFSTDLDYCIVFVLIRLVFFLNSFIEL